jgi:hypothetical protein
LNALDAGEVEKKLRRKVEYGWMGEGHTLEE